MSAPPLPRLASRAIAAALELLEKPEANSDQCCVFARLVCRELYGAEAVSRAPVADWHLWDVSRPWSPVEAAAQCGLTLATALPPVGGRPLVAGGLHLCQGWRGVPGAAGVTGHTWLWYAHTAEVGVRIDAAGAQFRAPPGVELRAGRWTTIAAPYAYGIAVAVLRQPAA